MEEAKREGAKKPAEAPFQRTFGVSRPVSFVVSEKAPDAGDKAAWSRVLAVFVQGKEWQFREWPFQVRLEPPVLAHFQESDSPSKPIKCP